MSEHYSLVGIDGNAYSIMGYVAKCMKRELYESIEIEDYRDRATSGDYDNLLKISQEVIDELNNKENKAN